MDNCKVCGSYTLRYCKNCGKEWCKLCAERGRLDSLPFAASRRNGCPYCGQVLGVGIVGVQPPKRFT